MTEKLEALNEGDTDTFTYCPSPKCPHCAEDFNIREEEAWHLYDESEEHEVECPSCHLAFKVYSHASWLFSTDEQEDD